MLQYPCDGASPDNVVPCTSQYSYVVGPHCALQYPCDDAAPGNGVVLVTVQRLTTSRLVPRDAVTVWGRTLRCDILVKMQRVATLLSL